MSRKRVVRTPQQSLSPAESAWLYGDPAPETLTGFYGWCFWCLQHGFESHYRGRRITAHELFEQYGDTVSESRRRALRRELATIPDRSRRQTHHPINRNEKET